MPREIGTCKLKKRQETGNGKRRSPFIIRSSTRRSSLFVIRSTSSFVCSSSFIVRRSSVRYQPQPRPQPQPQPRPQRQSRWTFDGGWWVVGVIHRRGQILVVVVVVVVVCLLVSAESRELSVERSPVANHQHTEEKKAGQPTAEQWTRRRGSHWTGARLAAAGWRRPTWDWPEERGRNTTGRTTS